MIVTKRGFVFCMYLLLCVTGNNLETEDEENEDYDIEEDLEEAVKEEVRSLQDFWKEDRGGRPTLETSLCPPPISLLSSASCNATKCSKDDDCGNQNNNTYLCCFNGCVDTCVLALDPPMVFDWLDNPPDRRLIVPDKAAHSSPPEELVLRGGCVVTPAQFDSLEKFKQNKYVSHCFCDVGGVFCKIIER